jgi:protein-disulfide isomerase
VAASLKGRFWDLHWPLVIDGPLRDERQLAHALNDVGLDPDELQQLADAPSVTEIIESDLALADDLHIMGTPTTFIGTTRIDGTISLERLRAEIDRR